MGTIKEDFTRCIYNLQDSICRELEAVDGSAAFKEDTWTREGGGGGRTRVISGGGIFEKGGVNVSAVHGELDAAIRNQLAAVHSSTAKRVKTSGSGPEKGGQLEAGSDKGTGESTDKENVEFTESDSESNHEEGQNRLWFYATGLSLVLHPENPMTPTVHANFRFFELYNDENMTNPVDAWFGGGADLTPYYLRKEDAVHFHQTWKNVCDKHGDDLYRRFKIACDDYFYNSHREEARGIGGLFFDYLRGDGSRTLDDWRRFTEEAGSVFTDSYIPIVNRRREETFDSVNRYWQEIRRGRYVEFNLIHDRGTLFGLRSGGRVESILMSLPPRVRWDYDYKPAEGSPEEELLGVMKNPVDWVESNN